MIQTLEKQALITVIVRVAIVTVQVIVADADVGAGGAVAQGDATDAAPEAVDVIKQPQALDDHRSASSCFKFFMNRNEI